MTFLLLLFHGLRIIMKRFDLSIFYSLLKHYFPYIEGALGMASTTAPFKCLCPAPSVPVVQLPK